MLFNMYMQLNVNNLGLKMLMHTCSEPVNILLHAHVSKCYLCDEYNCSLQLFGCDPLVNSL